MSYKQSRWLDRPYRLQVIILMLISMGPPVLALACVLLFAVVQDSNLPSSSF